MRIVCMTVVLMSLVVPPAFGQQAMQEGPMKPAVQCPATPAPLPTELAGWAAMAPVQAATSAAAIDAATLKIGQGARATLAPTPSVTYPLRPEHPGGTVSKGGLFAFTVADGGRYRVAIGSGAWLDVVRDGKAVLSVAHGHGPDCSGIKKMVDFDLTPGRYVLQVAGNGEAELPLMVAKLPA
jgi:hypothetical protein